MACSDIKKSLCKCIDQVLGARDSIGAYVHTVCLVKRMWDGETIGDGKATDIKTPVRPTPGIREFAHNIMVQEGGAIQQGDILLTSISKNRFSRDDLSVQDDNPTHEKFFLIDDREYRIVNVTEHLVTWNVLVRQTINRRNSKRRYA
jgi:hypothetical protein